MDNALITSSTGILAVLAGTASFFFWVEKRSGWKVFNYFPPLLFIYTFPVLFSNTKLIAQKSPVYDWMGETVLPLFLVIMLLDVDFKAAVRVMGKGVFVMLFGTAGVVLGAPVAYFIVKSGLGPEGWKAFGTLAGSWIGGTANMAAVAEGLKTSGTDFGLAVIGDNIVYIVWLPIMLGSKNIAIWFNRFAKVNPKRVQLLEESSGDLANDKGPMEMRHLLYLIFLGMGATYLATYLAGYLPAVPPILTAGSWRILLISTFGIALSFTPARKIPGSHQVAMALIYLFVANMGARANIGNLAEHAPWFILGAYIWIFIHGGFCVLGARLFHIDIHSTAIASAANIGGAASAPVVAAYHNQKLVPVSILMALLGYGMGTYAAYAAAWLAYLVA